MDTLNDDHLYKGMPKPCSDQQMAAADKANDALDWIESLSDRIQLLLISGARQYHLDATRQQAQEAMELIREALSDLFHEDRHRLMEISGWRSPNEKPSLQSIVNTNGFGTDLTSKGE